MIFWSNREKGLVGRAGAGNFWAIGGRDGTARRGAECGRVIPASVAVARWLIYSSL